MNWLHDLLLDMIRAYRGYIGSTLSEAPDRWREYRRASVAVMLRVRGMRKHYVARAQAAEERARRAEQALRETGADLDLALTAMSEAGIAAGWPEADCRAVLSDIDVEYRRLYVRANERDRRPPPAATETMEPKP